MLSVYIDGQLVSDSFQLFDAATETIASRICEECYAATGGAIVTCSGPDIAARRHASTVYWYLADHESASPLVPNVPLNQVWSFPSEQYESHLNGNSSRLPDFSSPEIQLILNRATIYRPELGLFTIPDIDDDPQGRQLLDFIAQCIASRDWKVCPAPETYRTITVGIEAKGIPEVVVQVGKVNEHGAICFVSNPSFPLWLTSERIERRVAAFAE